MKAMGKDEIELKLYIVPASFCARWYINDARYLPSDTTFETERLKKPRDNGVNFWHASFPSFHKDFTSFGIVSVPALFNILLG